MSDLIFSGDCLSLLRSLESGSVDHAITDPPYSAHVHAQSFRSGDPKARQKKAHGKKAVGNPTKRDLGFASLTPELMDAVAFELGRVVRRWTLIFCDIELAPGWWWAGRAAGMKYVRTMIWDKPNGTPQFSGDRPAQGYEAIVLLHAGEGAPRWNGGGRRGVFTHPIETGHYGRERVHSTEKPISLMLELVDLFTNHEDLVIDPFAGSGTTGVACIRRGRRFRGAELDPAMALTAEARLLAERCDSTLGASRAGQRALFSQR